jgi:hypothetical protein
VRGGRPLLALGAALAALLATEAMLRMPSVATPSPFEVTPQGTLVRSEAWEALAPFELAPRPDLGRPRIVWMGSPPSPASP